MWLAVNSADFINLIRNSLTDILDVMPLENRQNVWFQMDGCPAHKSRNVRDQLNEHFEEQWIGRYGPVRWPPRSPDLTPLDFHVWNKH